MLYRVKDGEQVVQSKTATVNGVLEFSIVEHAYQVGDYSFQIEIESENCGALMADQTAAFTVNGPTELNEITNQSICLGETAIFNFSANVSIATYGVYIGAELIAENATGLFELNPAEKTVYTVKAVPQNGCEETSASFEVEVFELAIPGILVSHRVLESSVTGDAYQWYLDGEILEGATDKVLVAQLSGDYSVKVIRGGCSRLSDTYTFNEEVLNANRALENAVHLYPNPVIEMLNIDLDQIGDVKVTIFTVSGKFMNQYQLKKNQNSIDLSKLAKGTYLIQLEAEKGSITKRIVKR